MVIVRVPYVLGGEVGSAQLTRCTSGCARRDRMSGPRLLAKAAGMLVAKTQFQRDLHRLNPYPALKDRA
jgi:hypothetical protein